MNANHADAWLALRKKMEEALKLSRPTWRYQPNLDIPKKEAEDEWLGLCERHRPNVDSLVLRWIDDPTARSENEKEQFLLAVRFYSVSRLAALHVFVRGGIWRSPFPPPAAREKELLATLLIEWWWGVGVSLAFDVGWMTKMET